MSSVDHERIALGNEEGLFVVHVTKDGKRKVNYYGVTSKQILSDSSEL